MDQDNQEGTTTKAEGQEETTEQAEPTNEHKATMEKTINLPAIQKFAETQDINIALDNSGGEVEKAKRGRPARYTPEQLETKINEYFEGLKINEIEIVNRDGTITKLNEPLLPTYAGLAYHLGIDRHTLWFYKKYAPFYHTIKKARDKITKELESALMNSKTNPVGKIFLSKNYGYTDKQEIEITKPLEIILTDYRGRKAQEVKPISETKTED